VSLDRADAIIEGSPSFPQERVGYFDSRLNQSSEPHNLRSENPHPAHKYLKMCDCKGDYVADTE
jgi:hypothetical protein